MFCIHLAAYALGATATYRVLEWLYNIGAALVVYFACRIVLWWRASTLWAKLCGHSPAFGPFVLQSAIVGGRDVTSDLLRASRDGLGRARLSGVAEGSSPYSLVSVAYRYLDRDYLFACSAAAVEAHDVHFPPYESAPRARSVIGAVRVGRGTILGERNLHRSVDVSRTLLPLAGPDQTFYKHIAPDIVPLPLLVASCHPEAITQPGPEPLSLILEAAGSKSVLALPLDLVQRDSLETWNGHVLRFLHPWLGESAPAGSASDSGSGSEEESGGSSTEWDGSDSCDNGSDGSDGDDGGDGGDGSPSKRPRYGEEEEGSGEEGGGPGADPRGGPVRAAPQPHAAAAAQAEAGLGGGVVVCGSDGFEVWDDDW